MMRFISCFSGIEAASVASRELEWEAVAFSEIEPFPCAVLDHYYPHVPNLGDITKVDWSKYYGTADIVVGGAPCQAFSVAGLRRGLDDARGNLTLEYFRVIHEVKPKWVFYENVPGIKNAPGNPFGCLLAGLAGYDEPLDPPDGGWTDSGMLLSKEGVEGYHLAWRTLDAQHFGVAQRRKRIFLVAYLGDEWFAPCEVLFEQGGEGRNPTEGRETRQETAGTAQEGVAPSQSADLYNGNLTGEVVATMGTPGSSVTASGPTLTCNHEAPIACIDKRTGIVSEDVSHTLKTDLAHDMGPCVATGFYPQMKAESMSPMLDLSPCLVVGTNPGYQNGVCVEERIPQAPYRDQTSPILRRLTPTECERLQGFPDGYTRIPYRNKPADKCPDGPRYKALGNSWAVPCVRWIFERIQAMDDLLRGQE